MDSIILILITILVTFPFLDNLTSLLFLSIIVIFVITHGYNFYDYYVDHFYEKKNIENVTNDIIKSSDINNSSPDNKISSSELIKSPNNYDNVLDKINPTSLNDEYNIINNTIAMEKSKQELINEESDNTLDPEEELFNMKTIRDYSNYDINLKAIKSNHQNYREMLKN